MTDNTTRKAVLKDGEVVNVIVAPDGWTPDNSALEVVDAPKGSGIEIGSVRQSNGSFVKPDIRTLDDIKTVKIRSINTESRSELRSVMVNGNTFQTDDRSVMRIMTATSRAKEDPSFSKTWITADNSQVELSNSDLIALGDIVSQHEEYVVFAARLAKDDVLAAQDKESVQAIDWRSYL